MTRPYLELELNLICVMFLLFAIILGIALELPTPILILVGIITCYLSTIFSIRFMEGRKNERR